MDPTRYPESRLSSGSLTRGLLCAGEPALLFRRFLATFLQLCGWCVSWWLGAGGVGVPDQWPLESPRYAGRPSMLRPAVGCSWTGRVSSLLPRAFCAFLCIRCSYKDTDTGCACTHMTPPHTLPSFLTAPPPICRARGEAPRHFWRVPGQVMLPHRRGFWAHSRKPPLCILKLSLGFQAAGAEGDLSVAQQGGPSEGPRACPPIPPTLGKRQPLP